MHDHDLVTSPTLTPTLHPIMCTTKRTQLANRDSELGVFTCEYCKRPHTLTTRTSAEGSNFRRTLYALIKTSEINLVVVKTTFEIPKIVE